MRTLLLLLLVACGSPAEPTAPAETDPAEAPAKPARKKARAAEAKAKAKAKAGKGKAAAAEKVEVEVWFVDQAKHAAGEGDPLVAVKRRVTKDHPPRNALWHLFRGPTPEEQERGLSVVKSGAEGFENLRIEDGVATLTLRGGCDAGGSTLSVYDLILPTLKQFDRIEHVKILDPQGQTASPEGAVDSRPACLEP